MFQVILCVCWALNVQGECTQREFITLPEVYRDLNQCAVAASEIVDRLIARSGWEQLVRLSVCGPVSI